MSISELCLQEISREQVTLDNLVSCYRFEFLALAQDNARTPSLTIMGFDRAHTLPKKVLRIDLVSQEASHTSNWTLFFDLNDASILFECWLGGADISALPNDMVIAASELWIEHLASFTPELSQVQVQSIGIVSDSSQLPNLQNVFLANVDVASKHIKLYCLAGSHVLSHTFKKYALKKELENNIQLPVSFLFGQTELNVSDIRKLEHGDILLPSQSLNDRQETVVLVNHQPIWQADIDDKEVTLLHAWNKDMTDQITDDTTHDNVSAGHDIHPEKNALPEQQDQDQTTSYSLEDVSLNIQFELPGKTMTFSEVQSLTSGYVFTLRESAEQDIAIVLNGKVCGKGRLVNIEGTMGIQVKEWGQNGN